MSLPGTLWQRALVGVALVAVASTADRWAGDVLRAAILYDHWGELREGLVAAKFMSSGLGTLGVAVAVATLDRRRWRRALVLLLVAASAGLAAGGLKIVTGRERPSHGGQPVVRERMAFHGPARGLGEAPFQSFPSGHAAAAFALATCLAAFYPRARSVLLVVAVASGLDRVVEHEHFLSDVVAGGVVGYLAAARWLAVDRLRSWWWEPGVDRRRSSP